MRPYPLLVSILVLASLPAPLGSVARADEPTGRALFDEGDKLMKAGKFAEACEKFAASQHEFGRSVTLVRLGDCYEKLGKTASAWSTYREVKLAAEATKQKPTADKAKEDSRIEFADARIAALEPNLTRVRIVVAQPSSGLVVKRDGVVVSAGAYGVPTPIDPGKHAFEAAEEGKVPWREERELGKPGVVDVSVPALQPAVVTDPKPGDPKPGESKPGDPKPGESKPGDPKPGDPKPGESKPGEPEKPPASMPQTKSSVVVTQSPVAIEPASSGPDALAILGVGAGVIFAGIGGLVGVSAKSKYDQAVTDFCNGDVCVPEGKRLTDDARRLGNTATAFVAVGGALLAGGITWWIVAPRAPSGSASAPAVGLGLGGVTLAGRF
jgi:hypothetical protein